MGIVLRRFSRSGAAALALAAASVVCAPTASAAPTPDGLVGIRAVPGTDDDASGFIVEDAAPGTDLAREVAVSNGTTAPVEVRLYVGPASMQSGEFVFGERGASNVLTRWATVEPSTLRIEPGREVRARVTITVPAGAMTTDHQAVVWAELPSSAGTGVDVVNRVGVRVYLSIDPSSAGSASQPSWLLLGGVAAAVGGGLVTVVVDRKRRGFARPRYALRRNPWPKNPPRGRAWA